MRKIRYSSPRVMPASARGIGRVERIRLIEEILATYCLARWWIRRLSFEEAVERARRVPTGPRPLTGPDVTFAGIRLGSAVQRTLRAMPLDARCLVTALVLTRVLARRGIASTFVLGVRAHPDFAAHAWLERDDVALLPTTADFRPLTVL